MLKKEHPKTTTKEKVVETKNTNQNQDSQTRGVFVEPKVYLSKDRNYITLVIPGTNFIVRKSCNYFKAVMGLPWERLVK